MIDVDDKEIVAARRTAGGARFVLFTGTDVQPHWGQRFWGVVLDTGGDGFGISVRYGSGGGAPSGWTFRQLAEVARARMAAEYERSPGSGARAVLEALDRAIGRMPEGDPAGGGVTFEPGAEASPYRWTVARCRDLVLPLCPDPESRGEGVTPEQVLIVLDQMLEEWSGREPYLRRLWTRRGAVRDALAAEVRRVRIVRGASRPGASADPP